MKAKHQQAGFITLTVCSLLLFLITTVSFYVAHALIVEQQVANNALTHEQARQAAQAGLDHGQAYVIAQGNSTAAGTVLTDTLANGGSYSVTLSFPNGTNDIVEFSSVGTAGGVSKTFTERAMLIGTPGLGQFNVAIKSTGAIDMSGTSTIYNLYNAQTIASGGTTAIDGSATTVLSSGVSSDKNLLANDVTQNSPTLSATSDSDLFQDHFGMAMTDFQGIADMSFSSTGNTAYDAQLNGLSGVTVWIDAGGGEAQISSTTTIGTAAAPVTIVVYNGNFKMTGDTIINGTIISAGEIQMAGNSRINGLLYANNDSTITGASIIEGGVIVGGDLFIRISGRIQYEQSNIQTYGSTGGTDYARLIGSWKSF